SRFADRPCSGGIRVGAVPTPFGATKFYRLIRQGAGEQTCGVGASTYGSEDAGWQATLKFQYLLPSFLSNDGLEVSYHFRIRMRSYVRSQQIEGVRIFDIVAQGSIHGIFEGTAT